MTVQPSEVVVYCDEPQDLDLLQQLAATSILLSKIPKNNFKVLPRSARDIMAQLPARAATVVAEERPDYCFIYKNSPILIIELTEHGYTGDNPLQRFTRCAGAAENSIPYIYMTPFSRVRDDEMDREGGGSERNVNTDVFKGMSILSDTFGVPQIAINWPTASNGKPKKVSRQASAAEANSVFGELIGAMEVLIFDLGEQIASCSDIRSHPFVAAELLKLKSLFAISNRREPGTRYFTDNKGLRDLLLKPSTLLKRISKDNYFFKDKPERLLAYLCISEASIETVVLPSGKKIKGGDARKFLDRLVSLPAFEKSMIYYSGYKWRSDPHSGVAVNTDYIFCRTPGGRSTKDREASLVLVYPRVFLDNESQQKLKIDDAISELNNGKGDLYNLFTQRYSTLDEIETKRSNLLRSSSHIGIWGNGTKQARVFKRYCDLIILGDGVIVGENWREESESILKGMQVA